MKPTLLALDFKQGYASRYQPKLGQQRGFFKQTAEIYTLDGVWQLGGKEGLAILEQFRKGQLDVEPIKEKEQA